MSFRNVLDRVDVRQFGAKGDYNPGTQIGTDDRNAFIEAVTTAIASGSDLMIPPGNYYLSKYVLVDGAVGLRIEASTFARIYPIGKRPRGLGGTRCAQF